MSWKRRGTDCGCWKRGCEPVRCGKNKNHKCDVDGSSKAAAPAHHSKLLRNNWMSILTLHLDRDEPPSSTPLPPHQGSLRLPPSPPILLINLLVVVWASLSAALLIGLQLYLGEVGSWRLTSTRFPVSPALGQRNYEQS